jgi:hypothetical protein
MACWRLKRILEGFTENCRFWQWHGATVPDQSRIPERVEGLFSFSSPTGFAKAALRHAQGYGGQIFPCLKNHQIKPRR